MRFISIFGNSVLVLFSAGTFPKNPLWYDASLTQGDRAKIGPSGGKRQNQINEMARSVMFG